LSKAASAALEQLCRAYWYPLYAFVRRRGHDAEEAKDLTQGFFASLLALGLAGRAPEQGRFRSFLLAALGHYLANEWRRGQRQKRGGGQTVIALDALPAEERCRLEPPAPENPEQLYERRWAWTVMDQARQRLAAEHARAGKAELFGLLEPFLTGGRAAPARAALAARLGISAGAVDVAVHRLRRRYGELLRERIADTVADPAEVDAEIRHLRAALGG
jgi:RNA polymerase sigma-70 factor (ECF subfamily)